MPVKKQQKQNNIEDQYEGRLENSLFEDLSYVYDLAVPQVYSIGNIGEYEYNTPEYLDNCV